MNNLTERMSATYTPKMAIIVYQEEEGSHSTYLEQRDIVAGKMGAGRPLSKKCIAEIITALAEDNDEIEKGFHGVIPKTLIYADTTTGHTKLVWYNPPSERNMFFVEALGIPEGKIKLPGILYVVENNTLSVFAFKGKSPNNRLYNAPFFNIYQNGKVCLGSAKAKKPSRLTYVEAIEYWEKLFWSSEFSHLIGGSPVEGNLAVITKQCIESGKPFPVDVMKLSKFTVQEILK